MMTIYSPCSCTHGNNESPREGESLGDFSSLYGEVFRGWFLFFVIITIQPLDDIMGNYSTRNRNDRKAVTLFFCGFFEQQHF